MNKQQVFRLYSVNEKQLIKFNQENYCLLNVDRFNNAHIVDLRNKFEISPQISNPDCKLLLKSIADMSAGDYKAMNAILNETDNHIEYYKEQVLLHITHGYCINNEWIENGWVEVVK